MDLLWNVIKKVGGCLIEELGMGRDREMRKYAAEAASQMPSSLANLGLSVCQT